MTLQEAQSYYAASCLSYWHSIHAGCPDRQSAIVGFQSRRRSRNVAAVKTFVFKLKASNGSGMSNVLQNGVDQREAERKILAKYPGATILEVRQQ
jgi:hypothetical protein